jgi:hypothetical protein
MTRKELIAAYKGTFATESGVKVLADLSQSCMEQQQTFVPGAPDATAFNQGMREVILRIRRRLDAAPGEQDQETAINES